MESLCCICKQTKYAKRLNKFMHYIQFLCLETRNLRSLIYFSNYTKQWKWSTGVGTWTINDSDSLTIVDYWYRFAIDSTIGLALHLIWCNWTCRMRPQKKGYSTIQQFVFSQAIYATLLSVFFRIWCLDWTLFCIIILMTRPVHNALCCINVCCRMH